MTNRTVHSKQTQMHRANGMPWKACKSFVGQVRRYSWNGRIYQVRDVFYGGKLLRCEFAVRNPNGSKRWLPTYEGVMFEDISPWSYKRG